MSKMAPVTATDAETVFSVFLEELGGALEASDADATAAFFLEDGYWKDFLAFTWEHRYFVGRPDIRDAFAACLEQAKPRTLRISPESAAPKLLRRSGAWVIEGYFDFDTDFGRGTTFVRLATDPANPEAHKIQIMLTTLQALHGFEPEVCSSRPTGNQYAMYEQKTNWKEDYDARRAFADRDPEVLIVGAGHAGLILATRLRLLDVDALVVEKSSKVGDVWRDRYHALTLHNESTANHMPFMPFPDTWPVWLPKDKMGSWLEMYAEAMELNVWTSTELLSSEYDEAAKCWTAVLRLGDGSVRTMRCKHLVAAIGVSGSIPKKPKMAGLEGFAGEVVHSGEFTTGQKYAGKHAIVVGTGNSAHDVAQDLYVNGAEKVWIYQRSPTCVVSLDPTAIAVFSIYREDASVEDIDMITSSLPYPVLKQTYQFLSSRAVKDDAELLEGLKKAGFETWYGRDNTGFHMMYLRGEGGYYINVGCSDLIIDGKIGVIQARDTDHFVPQGLKMKDGSIIPADLVVQATGFENMQEGIRRLVGDEVADKVGPIWGFDEDYQMRAMWRRTAQDGFWVMGGALIDTRLNSRFLALEIKAELEGILPSRDQMPIVPRKDATAEVDDSVAA